MGWVYTDGRFIYTNSLSMASNSQVCRLCSDLVHEKNTTAIEILNERVLQVTVRLDVSDSKDDGLSSYINYICLKCKLQIVSWIYSFNEQELFFLKR